MSVVASAAVASVSPSVIAFSPTSDLARSIAARAEGKVGLGIKQMQEGRADVFTINPYLLVIEKGFNVRDFGSDRMKDRVETLARSIAKHGVKRPLKVRMRKVEGANRLVVTDGECRLRAVYHAIEELGAEIRAIKVIMENVTDAEAVLGIAIENDALELTPLEKGAVFKRLEAFGWSIADIAASVGLTTVRVTQLIELTMVPEPVKQMIREGVIAPTLAGKIAKDNGFDEGATIAAVTAAREQATTAGKAKITPRNVAGTKTSFKSEIAAILNRAMAEDVEEDGILLALSREDAAALNRLIKLDCLNEIDLG